ncbi:putative transcription factor ssDNA-binding-TF family [Helianthus annuus]|nr:putative transcription factor ssDNA-binding-TF family [Helianthus annuus]
MEQQQQQLEPHNQKLQRTLIGILKAADLDIDTELSVRKQAEKLLGVQLSDLASKRLVRRIVESYLLSTPPADEVPEDKDKVEDVQTEKVPVDDRNIASDDGCRSIICRLSGKSRVSIEKLGGTKVVAISEYYKKQGNITSGKGITLNPDEWSAFCSSFTDIEEAITKMESKMRDSGNGKKQTEPGPSNPSNRPAYEADTCHPLIPIATARFTGKNYYCWRRQMEFFLNQVKIFYVLVTPCPKFPVAVEASFEEINRSKSHAQKWINDDYICRHTILNSLSDHLFDQYSVKTLNAKELWDDLNSSYADDYGTNTSHVNNYINFQMVDGVSVLEQVHELHRIADIISTSGTAIDEKFHVGVIISKLPPSWKHIQTKLMQQECLTLDNLVYMLKDEEDSRSQQKRVNGSRKKDMRKVCFGCHQEGHLRRDCPLTKSGNIDRNNQ